MTRFLDEPNCNNEKFRRTFVRDVCLLSTLSVCVCYALCVYNFNWVVHRVLYSSLNLHFVFFPFFFVRFDVVAVVGALLLSSRIYIISVSTSLLSVRRALLLLFTRSLHMCVCVRVSLCVSVCRFKSFHLQSASDMLYDYKANGRKKTHLPAHFVSRLLQFSERYGNETIQSGMVRDRQRNKRHKINMESLPMCTR